MGELKLRPYDGVALACFLTLPTLFYTGPATLTARSGQAAWMSVLGAHLLLLFVFLVTAALLRQQGGKDLILAARAVAGRPVAFLYGLSLAAYFSFSTGLLVRECAEILKTYGLALTPTYMVSGLLLATAAASNLFGGKAIAKSAGFFFLIVLLGIALILALGLNRYNPDYLFPILGNGPDRILQSGVIAASMIDGVLILGLFAPAFEGVGKLRKAGLVALGVSAACSVAFYLCLVMMFSAPLASHMSSGFMEMGKSIYYNRFFYRFEAILLFFLIFASSIKACIGLYVARKSLAVTLGLGSKKWLTLICALLAFAASVLPANLFDLTNRHLALTQSFGIYFMAGVPILLFLLSSVRRVVGHEK